MIVKPEVIEGVAPEIKKAMEELAKAAETHKWDLYPCKMLENGQFLCRPYRQEGTVTGDWAQIKIPAGIKHHGGGVFSHEPSKK